MFWRARYFQEKGNLEIVKALIANGYDINDYLANSPAELAVQTGRIDILVTLLDAGVNVNKPVLVGGDDVWTLLMCAANSGHLNIIKFLIERGADINATTAEGYSAIWFAAREEWLEIFNYLAPLTSPELTERASQKLGGGC